MRLLLFLANPLSPCAPSSARRGGEYAKGEGIAPRFRWPLRDRGNAQGRRVFQEHRSEARRFAGDGVQRGQKERDFQRAQAATPNAQARCARYSECKIAVPCDECTSKAASCKRCKKVYCFDICKERARFRRPDLARPLRMRKVRQTTFLPLCEGLQQEAIAILGLAVAAYLDAQAGDLAGIFKETSEYPGCFCSVQVVSAIKSISESPSICQPVLTAC